MIAVSNWKSPPTRTKFLFDSDLRNGRSLHLMCNYLPVDSCPKSIQNHRYLPLDFLQEESRRDEMVFVCRSGPLRHNTYRAGCQKERATRAGAALGPRSETCPWRWQSR